MVRPTPRLIFGSILILCIIALTTGGFWYFKFRTREPSEILISDHPSKSENSLLDKDIFLQGTVWYDTGIWVAPYKKVYVVSEKPVVISIGNSELTTTTSDQKYFDITFHTADKRANHTVNVESQAKLYLRAVEGEVISTRVIISDLPPETVQTIISAPKFSKGEIVFLVIIIVGALIGLRLITLYERKKKKEKEAANDPQ